MKLENIVMIILRLKYIATVGYSSSNTGTVSYNDIKVIKRKSLKVLKNIYKSF